MHVSKIGLSFWAIKRDRQTTSVKSSAARKKTGDKADATSTAIIKAGKKEAKWLEIPEGSSVFLFTFQTYDRQGRVVEYCRAYMRTDRVKLEIELKQL